VVTVVLADLLGFSQFSTTPERFQTPKLLVSVEIRTRIGSKIYRKSAFNFSGAGTGSGIFFSVAMEDAVDEAANRCRPRFGPAHDKADSHASIL
jgi:hypothetical protein